MAAPLPDDRTGDLGMSVSGERPADSQIDTFGATHQGLVRPENQDQFLVASFHKLVHVHHTSLLPGELQDGVSDSRGFLFMVADGVGGTPGGADAARAAVRSIAEHATHTMRLYYQADLWHQQRFQEELERSVLRTHEAVVAAGQGPDGKRGMSTTLTMVAVLWPRAYLVHVGDSRCYRLRGGRLEQMTRDQTIAEELVEAGVLPREQARKSPLSHVLARAVGGTEATPVTSSHEVHWDDQLLLCSDGLTKHVADAEIEAALAEEPTAKAVCDRLINLVLVRGASDNVTVVVGRLRPRSIS